MVKRFKHRFCVRCTYFFGAVILTKNADSDHYRYNGYGIGFDARLKFLWSDGSWGKNVVVFGADVSSSVLIIKKTYLGEGLT